MRRFAGMLSILGLLIGGSVFAQNTPPTDACVWKCEGNQCENVGVVLNSGKNCRTWTRCTSWWSDPDGVNGPLPPQEYVFCEDHCSVDFCVWA